MRTSRGLTSSILIVDDIVKHIIFGEISKYFSTYLFETFGWRCLLDMVSVEARCPKSVERLWARKDTVVTMAL